MGTLQSENTLLSLSLCECLSLSHVSRPHSTGADLLRAKQNYHSMGPRLQTLLAYATAAVC